MNIKKVSKIVVLLLVAVMVLMACGATQPTARAPKHQILRLVLFVRPRAKTILVITRPWSKKSNNWQEKMVSMPKSLSQQAVFRMLSKPLRMMATTGLLNGI